MSKHNHTSDTLRRECQQILASLDALGGCLRDSRTREDLDRLTDTLRRAEAKVAALKCDLAVRLTRTEGKAATRDTLREQLGMTSYQAKHLSQMAETLREMPNTRSKLQSGDITLQNVSALAQVAGEAGAALVDQNRALLEDAAQTDPDHFRKQAKRWAAVRSADRGERVLERQRRMRDVKMFIESGTGMGIVHAELDPVRFGQVRQALEQHAERLRRADSGGDVPPNDIRTHKQRRADALVELMTGRDAQTLRPLSDNKSGKAVTQLVVVADLGLLDGTRPGGECRVLGTGPVPPSILKTLTPDDQMCGIIFGGRGRVLWMGRNRRLANDAQRLAAVVRDGECVRCDLPAAQMHHVQDWRDGGLTDIDNLASLCGPHHRELQEHNLDLVQVDDKWQTRPRPGPPAPPPPARSAGAPIRAGPSP